MYPQDLVLTLVQLSTLQRVRVVGAQLGVVSVWASEATKPDGKWTKLAEATLPPDSNALRAHVWDKFSIPVRHVKLRIESGHEAVCAVHRFAIECFDD
eukprot:TRINITY_DN37400_c0_g1_i1.p2 TRINITY_DN37400_c0_g1~~TRINITY_DN37400_c0_g1_i1.p2  ORF type:complete len:105 (-),score=17.90 TRINITY_DN37400_c0_g1_i1:23-316(-)